MFFCNTQKVFVCIEKNQYWLDGYWMPYYGDLAKLVKL